VCGLCNFPINLLVTNLFPSKYEQNYNVFFVFDKLCCAAPHVTRIHKSTRKYTHTIYSYVLHQLADRDQFIIHSNVTNMHFLLSVCACVFSEIDICLYKFISNDILRKMCNMYHYSEHQD
jgi:hypothetical protein